MQKIKITIFFFSGTGNTWYIAKELARRFDQDNNHTELIAVECPKINKRKKLRTKIEESDLIGFGYPIHNSEIADAMKNFLEDLPENLSKTIPVFSFCTQMFVGGNAGTLAEKYIQDSDAGHTDYDIRWAAHFIMPCNLHLPPIVKSPTKGKVEKTLDDEQKYLDKFADKIMNTDGWIEGGFDLIRSMFSLKFPLHKKMLYINQDRCNKCSLCYDVCPMSNIAKNDGKYEVRGSCYFCVRCYSFCPTKAINISLEDIESTEQRAFRRYSGPIAETDPYELAGLQSPKDGEDS